MQQRLPMPTMVTLARVLVIIESVLWGLVGLLLAIGGAALSGLHFLVSDSISGVLIVFALVILAMAVAGIWAGIALGKLSAGPRATAIILCSLGAILGLLSLLGALANGGTVTTVGGRTTSSGGGAIFSFLLLGWNLLCIWGLAIDKDARAAFAAARGTYPLMAYGTAPTAGMLPPGSGNYYPPQGGQTLGAVPPPPGYGQQYPPVAPPPPQAPPTYPPQPGHPLQQPWDPPAQQHGTPPPAPS